MYVQKQSKRHYVNYINGFKKQSAITDIEMESENLHQENNVIKVGKPLKFCSHVIHFTWEYKSVNSYIPKKYLIFGN